MINATSSSWHAHKNSKQQHNISDNREQKMIKEENINLPSPSKSLQGSPIHRDSINSPESINSIMVEYETTGDVSRHNREMPRTDNMKTRSGGISSFLKPKFLKSRSSLNSSGSTEHIIRSEPNFTTKQRQSTIKDFADTSSEEENSKQYVYDAESINSILEEYEMRKSLNLSPTRKNDFIFKEDFDDSSELNRSRLSSMNKSNSTRNSGLNAPKITTKTPQVNRNSRSSVIERTLGNRSSQSSSGNSSSPGAFYDCSKGSNGTNSDSSGSAKFKVYKDKQNEGNPSNRRKVDRRNIISTSSNIDVCNRTSLSNLTTLSNIDFNVTDDNKYPASSTTSSHRQSRRHSDNRFLFDVSSNILESAYDENMDPNMLERILLPKDRTSTFSDKFPNTSLINMDETAIKNNTTRNITGSSMSTNELLYKLETFYDNDNDNNTQESIPNSQAPLKESKKNFYDLTAGVDSKTNLPVMLYKVQDKQNIERNNRWSVDDRPQKSIRSNASQASIQQNISPERSPKTLSGPQMSILEPSKSRLGQYTSTASVAVSGKGVSLSSIPSQTYNAEKYSHGNLNEKSPRPILSQAASPANESHSSITQLTANNRLHDTLSKNNSHEHMLKNPPSTKYNAVDSSYEDLEKNDIKPIPNQALYKTHSWSLFIFIMIIGLAIPPIYILLAVGFFDNKNASNRHYNLQLTYLVVNPNQHKRFSKTQKWLSFFIGLSWLCIVLAMIGVGLGVGLTRES